MRIASYTTMLDARHRWAVVRAMITLNLVALSAMYLSGQWDAAEHAKGAVDRFWYPPHFGIYFGLLAAAVLSGLGLALILREPGRTGAKLRRNAMLVLVVAANAMSVTGAPFDAWWHATFGIDLTVWSPPHLHIVIGTVAAALACTVYFLDDDPVQSPLRLLGQYAARHVLAMFALLLALLMASYIFFEYEVGATSATVLSRPLWTYPVLWTGFTLFVLATSTALTRRIGTAALVAALFLVARLAVLWLDRAVLDYRGVVAFPLVVPALAFDLLMLALWPRWGEGHSRLVLALVGLLTGALVAVSTPWYWSMMHVAPTLVVEPWRSFWPAALVAGLLGTGAGWWCGTKLRQLRPAGAPALAARQSGPVASARRLTDQRSG